jgi:hypothetical protein
VRKEEDRGLPTTMSKGSNLGVWDRVVNLPVFEVTLRQELERFVEDVWIMHRSPVEMSS